MTETNSFHLTSAANYFLIHQFFQIFNLVCVPWRNCHSFIFCFMLIKSGPPPGNRHHYCFTCNIRSAFLCFPDEMISFFPLWWKRKSVRVHGQDLWVCLKLLSLSLNLPFLYFRCWTPSYLSHLYPYVVYGRRVIVTLRVCLRDRKHLNLYTIFISDRVVVRPLNKCSVILDNKGSSL